MNLKKIEEDALEAVHQVLSKAREDEPAIEDLVMEALGAAGVPSALTAAFGGLLATTLAHFNSQSTAKPVVVNTPAAPEVPVSLPDVAEAPPVPPTQTGTAPSGTQWTTQPQTAPAS